MGIIAEFKQFAIKGNAIDLAVGIIIGAAFGKIVSSLVNDVIMPPIGLLLGKVNFSDMFLDLSGKGYASITAAKAAGAPVIGYGLFINVLIEFIIVAFVVFLLVRQINRLKELAKKKDEAEAKVIAAAPAAVEKEEVKLLKEIRDALKKKK